MKTLILQEQPSAELTRGLAQFERQFTYPLGPGRSFRIDHGDDYPRFFRAMGEGASLVVADGDRVYGTVGIAVRTLTLPEGRDLKVAYFGDLKVDLAARKSFVYLRLAWAADSWLKGRADAGFGVVMDGTRFTPDAYTGGFGIPAARVLGKTIVWKIACDRAAADSFHELQANGDTVRDCFRALSRGRYACVGANPMHRSEMAPVGLVVPGGAACGLVEDTRRCKRLIADDGAELRSAHLSFFAFKTPADGARIVRAALDIARRAGHPALFVAMAPPDIPGLEDALGPVDRIVAPATIFGGGLDDGPLWNINTSEI